MYELEPIVISLIIGMSFGMLLGYLITKNSPPIKSSIDSYRKKHPKDFFSYKKTSYIKLGDKVRDIDDKTSKGLENIFEGIDKVMQHTDALIKEADAELNKDKNEN